MLGESGVGRETRREGSDTAPQGDPSLSRLSAQFIRLHTNGKTEEEKGTEAKRIRMCNINSWVLMRLMVKLPVLSCPPFSSGIKYMGLILHSMEVRWHSGRTPACLAEGGGFESGWCQSDRQVETPRIVDALIVIFFSVFFACLPLKVN